MARLSVFALYVASAVSLGANVLLGRRDSYPSPSRPIGWRGDGSGAWPGTRHSSGVSSIM